MRTDELRNVLRDHAEEVPAVPTATRVQQVRGRVALARRRRAAATGGGVVAAVAAVALAFLPGLDGPERVEPAGPVEGVLTADGYTKDGVTYRADVLGEQLLGAVIGEPGDRVVSFEMTVPSTGLRISPTCYGVGFDQMVRVTLDGHRISGSSCEQDADPDPGKDGHTFPDGSPLDGWGIDPGDVVTVEAVLERRSTRVGTMNEGEGGVVGVGIYEDTRPRRVVGGTEVPELIERDGLVWELDETYEPPAGEPSVSLTREPDPGRELLVGAVSGTRGPSMQDFLLDGEVVSSSESGPSVGGSWETLHVFEDREGGTAELRVTAGLTGRTRVAFAVYAPVG